MQLRTTQIENIIVLLRTQVLNYLSDNVDKARGRPRRHRPTILAESANWAVNKIHGDMRTVQGRLLKVEATAWIAEKDLSNLHDFIAEYRRTLEGKEKKIIGVRKSSRRKIKH